MGIAWTSILDCTERGPRSTLANAVAVLQKDPAWDATVVWFDEFLDRILTKRDGVVREWTDEDDTRCCIYMQESVMMYTVSEQTVSSAVRYVAKQRRRHCLREYLDGLRWDLKPRVWSAFERLWGAGINANQPEAYIRAISGNFFRGLIARALRPGCQLDTMVIFEGAQGIGKSRALRLIGGDFYMLASESVTQKDFFQSFPGKWVIEIGEMDAFSRAERERVKLAISTPIDRYRSSYGRVAEDHPRQCVFAGTTNRDDWLSDETGGRRFWPIACGQIDEVGIMRERDQLFAEAYQQVQSTQSWWETPHEETLAVQKSRQHEDAWTPLVLDFLVGSSNVTSMEVLQGAIKMRPSDIDRRAQHRVSAILQLAGWRRQSVRRDGKVLKAFKRPDVTEDGDAVF